MRSLTEAVGVSSAQELIQFIADAAPVQSWVHREFAMKRMYFTPSNAARIDGSRRMINSLRRRSLTDEVTDAYLRASLIDSMDRVANTAGTYYAYLKNWSAKALRPFEFKAIETTEGSRECSSTLIDAEELVSSREFDVLYLDPPYNQRDYGAYYHLPETVATSRNPRPTGISGVDAGVGARSKFASPRFAESSMESLVSRAKCKLMVVHYSDDGLISPTQMRRILCKFGIIEEVEISALGYGTSAKRLTMHRIYLVQP
jgi:adenine-specific DNA-methyltransferase